VEDRESRDERHRVGREVSRAHEDKPRNRAQPHRHGQVMRQACRQGEEGDRARGDEPEGQCLLEQIRPAPAFPRPAAQHVADPGACEPGHRRRHRRPQLQQPEARQQGDLARRKRQGGTDGEPGELPADRTDAVRVRCPDHAVSSHGPNYSAQRQCHWYLSLRVVVTDDSGSSWAFGQEPIARRIGAVS
jgi:hypothetical protein